MFKYSPEIIVYSTEDKLPEKGSRVLVLHDQLHADYYEQWFRTNYLKEKLHYRWIPATFEGVSRYGEPIWMRENLKALYETVGGYITHWRYYDEPPEELKGVEFS